MLTALSLGALLLFAPATPPPVPAAGDDEGASATAADLERLLAEFEAAVDAWKEALRTADSAAERRELRDADPVLAFYPRFEELARAGTDGAWPWLVEHSDDLGGSSRVRAERKLALLDTILVPGRDPEAATRSAVSAFADSRFVRRVERADLDRLRERALTLVETDDARARIRLHHALALAGASDEDAVQRSIGLLREILEETPDVEGAEAAREKLYRLENLRVGCLAPLFEGTTVDGEPVHLADHRGEVVVLSFFGFW